MRDIVLYEGARELNVALTPIALPVANLYGQVTDAQTGYALQGVKVTLDGLVTYTDSLGRYAFDGLTPGGYTLTFEKSDYETLVL
ncbi:unnamed protein product [marine sediment metagenome]|uniref:Uncharacterized protein n=1 Tax=marine sediment metagenome TaxID=412755 RepID=X1QA85_9ZZZZ